MVGGGGTLARIISTVTFLCCHSLFPSLFLMKSLLKSLLGAPPPLPKLPVCVSLFARAIHLCVVVGGCMRVEVCVILYTMKIFFPGTLTPTQHVTVIILKLLLRLLDLYQLVDAHISSQSRFFPARPATISFGGTVLDLANPLSPNPNYEAKVILSNNCHIVCCL